MGIKNKLENAFYEIIAPEKQKLINDSKLLDKKIDNSSPLQEAINNLKNKIKISQTGKQREILEKQLKELEKLYRLYLEYKNKKITQKTKEELEKLFKGIPAQISLNQEQIHDDFQSIKKILESEEERLEDTYDIISYNTFRDLVEDNIDIIGTYESIPPQKYQEFFDIITITYIDFLEEKLNRKLTKQDEEFLIKNKGFYLELNEASFFIKKLIYKLPANYLNLTFNIKLKKENYEEEAIVNLKDLFNKLEKNKYNNKIVENTKNKEKTKKEELFTKKTIELFKKYFGKKEVTNRKSINNLNFTRKLYWAIDRGEITIEDYKKILEYGYYLAFKKEIESLNGKKGLQNILKYEKRWKEIFKNNLKGVISQNKAKDLFLLSWVEGNGLPQNKNRTGAIGYFQILLSTAREYYPTITEKELKTNPIKSAKIAAKYLYNIFTQEVKYGDSEEEKIKRALMIYNGNFIKRLKNIHRRNLELTFYYLFKELSYIKAKKASKKWKLKKLKEVHNKFFNKPTIGTSNFKILERKNQNLNSINKWINDYLNDIIKQQTMYPIQFNAFKKVYEEKKDN